MSVDNTKTNQDDYRDPQRNEEVTTMGIQADLHDDDMPADIDFSKGVRGKFVRPGLVLDLPVYLDTEVQAYLSARAKARGVDIGQLVNELLRKDIELIEAVR